MVFCNQVIRGTALLEGRLLCAIGPVEPGGRFRLYLNARTPRALIRDAPHFAIDDVTRIGGGFRITGRARPSGDTIQLPIVGAELTARCRAPMPEFFDGLRCALALNAGQSPQQIIQWLEFHVRHHGLQAALIVDRHPPQAGDALAEALAAHEIPGLEALVLVRFDTPLGQPDTGAEAHPLQAPEAPGKDRMKRPAPDPWHAPFGEAVVLELLRDLYLSRARAVLHLDVSDLALPVPGATVFDCAEKAPEGVVSLTGRRVYPWGLKKGVAAEFGDHICQRFDAGPGSARWCIDLCRAPQKVVWRQARVSGASASDAPMLHYVRCMALRHPGASLARIVPKSALVEAPELVRLMAENFSTEPRRAPRARLSPAAQETGTRSGIVTCMKNEGPFILEWLAYHQVIGVEDFLIYSNDCTDGTDALLDLLQAKGHVQHRDNPYRAVDMKPQHAALQAAQKEPLVRELDWVIGMDVDEFINIHVGDGRLADLYTAVGDANMISMTWRLFGNADVTGFEDRPITEQFTACAPLYARKPHQAWGFKTAMRNTGIFKKLGVHRPKGLRPQLVENLRWVNGSGQPMPRSEYRNAWRSTKNTYGYDLVTLNHYALRSADSFIVKRDRGRVNHVDRDQGLTYWFRMNHNAEQDLSIQRMLPALRARLAILMADPDIAAAHASCVAAHRQRIAALLETEKYRAFHQEITGPRLRALSRMLGHFGSGVFFLGPDVIPDEVLARAGEPDFFFTVNSIAEAD